MAAVGIGAFYPRKIFGVVTAFCELFYNICNSVNAISVDTRSVSNGAITRLLNTWVIASRPLKGM